MRKIVFVSTMISVPWGGSEELWQKAALRLKKEGLDIYVNVKEWPEKPSQITALEQAGCLVERRGFYFHPSLGRKLVDKFLPPSYRFQTFYDPSVYLKDIQPDLVVVCQGSNQDGLDWMEVCQKLELPYLSVSQAASESFWPVDEVAERMSACFQHAKGNFFVSQRNLTLTEKQIGVQIKNGRVVRNPFNVDYTAELEWPSSETVKLACVGRLQPDAKGQDVLFEALAQKKWKERNLLVTLFGNGPNKNSLEKLVHYYSLGGLIELGGFCQDVKDIWRKNHALALPSRYEGLPLAVVEAMLCARVCIVTDVAGNNEVIENNVTGFLASAPTAELYDMALESAWEKRGSWEEIGRKAQNSIKNFIPESPIQVFADLIKMYL